ncbi:hypothetical protein KC328_g33 [Hortaea werneckii]|nr:hypothetical protein KC328_g33 [Hortaea werneckii]
MLFTRSCKSVILCRSSSLALSPALLRSSSNILLCGVFPAAFGPVGLAGPEAQRVVVGACEDVVVVAAVAAVKGQLENLGLLMNLESLSVWSYTFQVNALSADRSVRRVWCAVCQRMGLRMLLLLLLLLLSVCLLLWLRCVLTAILLLRKRPVDPPGIPGPTRIAPGGIASSLPAAPTLLSPGALTPRRWPV